MSIRSPDINADYLQYRDIEIVRGDTFGVSVRMLQGSTVAQLTESTRITFAIYERGNSTPFYSRVYSSLNTVQDADGYIYISMLPTETAKLKKSGNYTHELEWLVNDNTIYTLLQGSVKVVDDKIKHG